MNRIFRVARTEVLEHRRQPWMLGILTANYVLWGGLFLLALVVLTSASKTPEVLVMLDKQSTALGLCDGESALDAMLKLTTSTFGALLYTNLPLFVAIMSGYSVLHDRTVGALPFLMLAPLSRYQLLVGKLLGAMAIPTILHLVFVGAFTVATRQFDIMAPYSAQFGGSAAWVIAFAIGAPASSFFMGSIGTVISGLSSDVRTSMQFTSFVIGVLSLVIGFVLFDGISSGLTLQLGFVSVAIVAAMFILIIGSGVISRDIA